jgi:hypothetical protein
MKAILEFNLPEERDEFNTANKAGSYIAALQEYDNLLRGIVKYGSEEFSEADAVVVEKLRDKLHSIANDAGFDIWE